MKRGFLNSKKAKDLPLYDNGAPTADLTTTQKHSGAAVSRMPKGTSCWFRALAQLSGKCTYFGSVCNRRHSLCQVDKRKGAILHLHHSCIHLYYDHGHPRILHAFTVIEPNERRFHEKHTNMGVGLFAKSNLEVREVIFSERPLLVFPQGLPFYRILGLSEEELIKRGESMFEEKLQQALSVMTKDDADAFMSLSNSCLNSPQLYGIAMTNAFGTGTDIEEENPAEGKLEYVAVGKLASRINHSCISNVRVDFDIPTFSLRIIAKRQIKAGEQLFYCYCQADPPVKEQQRQLATYGFVCQCKACANATPESDKLREEKDARLQRFLDQEKEMFANPRFGIRSLDPLLKLEREIVEEGLNFGEEFVELLIILFEAYGKLNNRVREMEYYRKAHKYRGKTN